MNTELLEIAVLSLISIGAGALALWDHYSMSTEDRQDERDGAEA